MWRCFFFCLFAFVFLNGTLDRFCSLEKGVCMWKSEFHLTTALICLSKEHRSELLGSSLSSSGSLFGQTFWVPGGHFVVRNLSPFLRVERYGGVAQQRMGGTQSNLPIPTISSRDPAPPAVSCLPLHSASKTPRMPLLAIFLGRHTRST